MRKLPLIVFFILLVMTVISSVASYDRAQRCLDADLIQALSLFYHKANLCLKNYSVQSGDACTNEKVSNISPAVTPICTFRTKLWLGTKMTFNESPCAVTSHHSSV